MNDTKPENVKTCNSCGIVKPEKLCLKSHNICNDCNNERRRNNYNQNEERRKILIQRAVDFKKKKLEIKRQQNELYQLSIGIDNKKCRYCDEIKNKEKFRHNRLKCRDCERDEPSEKLKRIIRSRIFLALKSKSKHTVEYLGCTIGNYIGWLQYNDNNYSLENRGKEWHIDHVIPLSKFDLNNESEQLIAFNWRNTTALAPSENLKKNNKIIPQQIEEHLCKLKKYHSDNKIDFPQTYIDLFAKHLDVRETPKA